MNPLNRVVLLALCVFGGIVLADSAEAQTAKVGKIYHKDEVRGFKFRYPYKWDSYPSKPEEEEYGVIGKFDGYEIPYKIGKYNSITRPDLRVFNFEANEVESVSGEEGRSGLKNRFGSNERGRWDIAEVLDSMYEGFLRDFDTEKPLVDESKKIKGIEAHHRAWSGFTGNYYLLFDTWTFRLQERDICLLYILPLEHKKKWMKVFEKSAKTFELIDTTERLRVAAGMSYAELMDAAEQEAARTEGWEVMPTKSRRFIIKTNVKDKLYVKAVIKRLEYARNAFERDYPPGKPLTAVSIVRVCKDRDDFIGYSGYSMAGAAGWFNPATTELVLFHGREQGKDYALGVMVHEAFHQYCHFLFDQSEAHRWFDEGQGDYYMGAKFNKNALKITTEMPRGLELIPTLRKMVELDAIVPLEEHLYFSKPEWEERGYASYAQSWSIVYMLRQGMDGRVPKSIWKKEYEHILHDYITTLHSGYLEAYKEVRQEMIEVAAENGEEVSQEELDAVNRFDLTRKRQAAILKHANDNSWGQIDLEQFEQDWLKYVKKYLK
jgi:hypothetical protein